jgi:hypothetical protein
MGGGATEVVKEVGKIADKFIQTPEERQAFEAEMEREISKRWVADVTSSSWLAANVRPLVVVFVIVALTVMTILDATQYASIPREWVDLWKVLSVTIIAAYFGGRTMEKRRVTKSVFNNKQ